MSERFGSPEGREFNLSQEAPSGAINRPEAAADTGESLKSPHFHFLYFTHAGYTDEYVEEAAAECDVIASEMVLPQDQKTELFKRLNDISSNPNADIDEHKQWLQENYTLATNLLYALAIKSRESGGSKIFVPLDVASDEPWFQQYESQHAALFEDEYVRTIKETTKISELRAVEIKLCKSQMETVKVRDSVVAQQIKDLNIEFTGEDLSVAVILGKLHTGSYHETKKGQISASRAFVPSWIDEPNHVFGYYDEVSRRIQFESNESLNVPDELIDRAILENYLRATSVFAEDAYLADDPSLRQQISNIPSSRVTELLESILSLNGRKYKKLSEEEKAEVISDRLAIVFPDYYPDI